MDTVPRINQTQIVFINDKTPVLDKIGEELIASGYSIPFRTETIEEALLNFSQLKELPLACILDLDFQDTKIQSQIKRLIQKYPLIRFIAHSDLDDAVIIKSLRNSGINSYLLIGSDVDDFKNAIGRN